MNVTTVISSKGQVTIPKYIRDFFALEKEDKLVFTVVDNNAFLVKPIKKNFLDFGGSTKPKRKPEDFSKVRIAVMEKMARKFFS